MGYSLVSIYANLVHTWGLAPSFAEKASVLISRLEDAGLSPQITSGYRSPQRQQELIAKAAAGDPNVFTPVSPSKSKHVRQNMRGEPAAEAIDIVTSNPERAGRIAQSLGIEAGVFYSTPDPVHFETADSPVKKAMPLLVMAGMAAAGWWMLRSS